MTAVIPASFEVEGAQQLASQYRIFRPYTWKVVGLEHTRIGSYFERPERLRPLFRYSVEAHRKRNRAAGRRWVRPDRACGWPHRHPRFPTRRRSRLPKYGTCRGAPAAGTIVRPRSRSLLLTHGNSAPIKPRTTGLAAVDTPG